MSLLRKKGSSRTKRVDSIGCRHPLLLPRRRRRLRKRKKEMGDIRLVRPKVRSIAVLRELLQLNLTC